MGIADVWNGLTSPSGRLGLQSAISMNDTMGGVYLCDHRHRTVAEALCRESLRVL
jgi:hypothetical protein